MANVFSSLRQDLRRLGRAKGRLGRIAAPLTNRGFHAILLSRLSHALCRLRVPLLPMLFTRIAQTLFAVDIDYRASLGPGIVIVHGIGLVIGNATVIEGDCCLY